MRRNPLLRAPLWARFAVALLVCAALAAIPHGHELVSLAAAPLLLGPIKGVGKTYQMLSGLARPASNDQPESIPHVLYDTQTYPQAGAATLTFFKNAAAANSGDPTLSNFSGGSLDAGYYFEIHRIHAIIHSMPSINAASAVTGAGNDVEILHKTARGVFSFTYKGKPYGPIPLSYLGRPGGPMPAFAIWAAAAQTYSTGETENNGGFPVLGNIILAPATQFVGQMQFNATAVNQNGINITIGLMGVLHRPLA